MYYDSVMSRFIRYILCFNMRVDIWLYNVQCEEEDKIICYLKCQEYFLI